MPRSRSIATSTLVAAPLPLVVEAARDIATIGRESRAPGVTRGLVATADTVVLGHGLTLHIECREDELTAVAATPRWRGFRYQQRFRATVAGTLVTDQLCWPARRGLTRAAAIRLLQRRGGLIRDLVAGQVRVVVAAALLADGRLLAACRAAPRAYAGWWELPGGKVEPDETPQQALVRECHEELGVRIEVGDRVGPDLMLRDRWVLRTWTGRITHGTPTPHEHAELRWLGAAELESVRWLPGDLALLPELRSLLSGPPLG